VSRPESGEGGGLPDEYHNYGDREHGTWFAFDSDRSVQRHARDDRAATPFADQRGGYEVPEFNARDRVKVTRDVGGLFGSRVPRDTVGRVVSTRDGVFHSYVTVAFDNGYTEEVRTTDLSRLGWLD